MAPFADDDTIMEEQQAWVRPYDGLQGDIIRVAERVFCACHITPASDGRARTGGETVERIAVVQTILIDAVQFVEL